MKDSRDRNGTDLEFRLTYYTSCLSTEQILDRRIEYNWAG